MTRTRPLPSALTSVRPIFRAVTLTIVPDAADLDDRSWIDVEAVVSETLGTRSPTQQGQVRLLLWVVQWLPALWYGRSFTALDRPRRERVLNYLQDHRLQLIRTGFWGLRTLVFLGYYGRAEMGRFLGYTPSVRGWDALR